MTAQLGDLVLWWVVPALAAVWVVLLGARIVAGRRQARAPAAKREAPSRVTRWVREL